MLTEYVIGKGHRRIAYLHGESTSVTDVRLTSFLHTMHQAGLEVPDEYVAEIAYHNPTTARRATRQLLALPERPTCILASDDYAALGSMEAIREAGLRIPEDISVAGYDGVPLLQLCRPRLTTIVQDTGTIGSTAARKLIHLIDQPRTTFQEVMTVPCKLEEAEPSDPFNFVDHLPFMGDHHKRS